MTSFDDLQSEFCDEMGQLIQVAAHNLTRWCSGSFDGDSPRLVLSALHTMKGSAGLFGHPALADLLHAMEDVLQPRHREKQPPLPAEADVVHEGLAALRDWLAAFRTREETPNLDGVLARVRAMKQGSPRVIHLVPDLNRASPPLPAPSTSSAPPETDMVGALLGLLSQGELGDKAPISRPPGTPLHQPLGFSAAAPPPPRPLFKETHREEDTRERPSPWGPSAGEEDRAAPRKSPPPRLQRPGGAPEEPVPLGASHRSGPERTPTPTSQRIPPPPSTGSWPTVVTQSWPDLSAELPLIGDTLPGRMRIDAERLDDLLDLVGELLHEQYRQAHHLQLWEESGGARGSAELASSFQRFSQRLEELRDQVVRLRLKPIHGVFRKYPHMVEDLGRALGKEVDLQILGEDSELDRALLEGLYDPLTQLLRNAIDHGIEPAAERMPRGKPRRGTITLSASRADNLMVIEVHDDGRGIDAGRLATRAVAEGLISMTRLQEMGDEERLELIFLPGLSTSSEVTETSGRGMGMDVVRSHVRKLGGRIEVASQSGQGTTLRLLVPLTLALVKVLVARVAGLAVGFPLTSVLELLKPQADQFIRTRDGWLLRHRSHVLQAAPLGHLLGLASPESPQGSCPVAVVQVAEKRLALWVDQFDGLMECMVKTPGRELTAIPAVHGATTTVSGELVLVLDPARLAERIPAR